MRRLDLVRFRRSTAAFAAAGLFALAAAAGAQTTAIGLSTVKSQRFGNENLLGFYTPQGGDLFGWALATGDFNGDGADDLATGIRLDNGIVGSDIQDSGTVIVRYGILGSGLAANLASTVLRQTANPDPAEVGDQYGYALASCDFNGDGFDDLAVGVPYENYGGEYDAGAVQIHYGSPSGIHTSGDAFFTESTAGIPGDVEEGDLFAKSLACGDFNGDDRDDLVVGVPWESIDGAEAAGMVVVIPGSPNGLDHAAAIELDQNSLGIGGGPEWPDNFGWAVAAGDFDGDLFDDLAIGVPGEDSDEGQLEVVFGGPSGLTAAGSLFWSESFLGGTSEEGDFMGGALAAADFDGDGRDDLAIGIPGEDTGSAPYAGQVAVLYGSPGGFDLPSTRFFDQNNVLGAGTSETEDFFGHSLAAADFDRDGRADLAIGHREEYVSGPDDGAATVLMGSPAGLTAARHRGIAAGYDGFAGDPLQHQKDFSYALATGDFDGDGHGDLVLSAPYENVGGLADVGTETVLYGALFADGVENGNTTLWSQTVSSPYTTTFNNLQVTTGAKLGPTSSKAGIRVNLFSPTLQRPAASTYVRVGPEAGFNNERTLNGTFFIDPQGLTMSPNPGVNVFSMMTFKDGVGTGSKTRLTFELNRNDSVGGWAILANSFNETANALQFAGGAGFTTNNPGDPNTHNNRIDWSWRAGNPGHLTVWHTRFVNGVPGTRQLLFDVDLPGTANAVINHAFAGMVSGQDSGTSGSFFLDELSFRR
jgi:hypothetical protein